MLNYNEQTDEVNGRKEGRAVVVEVTNSLFVSEFNPKRSPPKDHFASEALAVNITR
jgi:hypothetical protein